MVHASVISELRRLRLEDCCEFQDRLSSSMRPCLKPQNNKIKEVNEEMLDALWAGTCVKLKISRKQ